MKDNTSFISCGVIRSRSSQETDVRDAWRFVIAHYSQTYSFFQEELLVSRKKKYSSPYRQQNAVFMSSIIVPHGMGTDRSLNKREGVSTSRRTRYS